MKIDTTLLRSMSVAPDEVEALELDPGDAVVCKGKTYYWDKPMVLMVDRLNRGENAWHATMIRTELAKVDATILVQAKSHKTVEVMTTYLPDFSRNVLYRAEADVPGLRTGFRAREEALIELRSLFIPNDGTKYLLDLLSRITDEKSVSSKDNGVTQTVEARQGVALNAMVEVRPRVQLRPFRTFLEVEQPESEFLLRVDADKGIGLFEADGGVWKLEAKRNIADYFASHLADLIDAGQVVVMQ